MTFDEDFRHHHQVSIDVIADVLRHAFGDVCELSFCGSYFEAGIIKKEHDDRSRVRDLLNNLFQVR